MPAYNAEKYLDRCIESVTGQSYRELELIIIDDGSKDRTGEIADRWGALDYRIRVHHFSDNCGISAARNEGIRLAQGRYIAFIDADDIVHKDMYQCLYSIMVRNDADIVLCNEIAFRGQTKEPSFDYKPEGETTQEDHEQYIGHFMDGFTGYIGWCWNKLYKADCIKQIRFRDYGYEDLVFNAEYAQFVKKAVWTSDKLYGYRITEESTTAAGNRNLSIPAAESYIATGDFLADNPRDFTDRYQIYVLGKIANIYANCCKHFGREAAAEVYDLFIREYDRQRLRAVSARNAFKLWLVRYLPFAYCKFATRDVL